MIPIPKKYGKPRFCVNYIKLNAVTYTDAYPLPTIQNILDSLAGYVVFSTIDLNSGYWQCLMEENSRDRTAFTFPFGLYQFKVIPFGLWKNAPATFQRLMEMTLGELRVNICFVYLDDIIYSPSLEQHFRDLQEVFKKLREAKLTANMQQCNFFQTSLKFLGHIVPASGIQVDPDKTKAVEEFPVLTNFMAIVTTAVVFCCGCSFSVVPVLSVYLV